MSSKVITKTPQNLSLKYHSLTITLFLTNLTAPNKDIFSGKLLVGLRCQLFNS